MKAITSRRPAVGGNDGFSSRVSSLIEELEAVDWYNQRVDACTDPELKAILAHNRDEEIEHASMTLEWIRRRNPVFDHELRDVLFKTGPITGSTESRHAHGRDQPDSLLSLEAYAKARHDFGRGARAQEAAHGASGRSRDAAVRGRAHLRYQIQEMLRIERIFEEAGIQDELDAYNPLVPDGRT